ncbi:MAG: hypothetical protein ACTH31_13565, partial [Pseudoclavibacter sp.]
GMFGLVRMLWRRNVDAERIPVVLDAAGVRVRGIGPVPWHDLEPPRRHRVLTRSDVGGMLPVMPLTPPGRTRANAQPGGQALLIGPIPYLQFQVNDLVLPGISGYTEDEVLALFAAAHAMFVDRAGNGWAGHGTAPAAPPPPPPPPSTPR